MYDKQTLEKKRSQVKELFFQKCLDKSVIARKLAVSRSFVQRWAKSKSSSTKDRRGWPKGKRRSLTKVEAQRVIKIRESFVSHSAFSLDLIKY
ncbi:hypothetical protein KBI33_01360 [Candidatus Shapirobacteria bacterium]|nr:hypothetical protein [Candidatus Shapirobacteria bacterium]